MGEPIITIREGRVRGKIHTDFRGKPYYCFQGIPYAQPPVGRLRFKAPEPIEPWRGVQSAIEEGSECYGQLEFSNEFVGSEDCLFINVYTNTVIATDLHEKLLETITPIGGQTNFAYWEILPGPSRKLRPVMVWIHGGAFVRGSSKSQFFGPEFLLTEDIVFVSFNYRLGVFGFLSLEDPSLEVPGNAGLKDQVLALKWVKRNIAFFNGDPRNVTIFGESAGSACCHLLMLSPMSKDLFHKIILQSGCALNPWAKGQRCAKDLAKKLGFDREDERDIFEFLQAQSTETLGKAQMALMNSHVSLIRPWGPVVEKPSKLPAFLSEEPETLIWSGRYHKVPMIIGYTNREGFVSKRGESNSNTDFENSIPHFLNIKKGSTISYKIATMIKRFYYGNEEPSEKNIDMYYLLRTDNLILRDLYRCATGHSARGSPKHPVFFYRFSFDGSLNFFKKFGGIEQPGAGHADELGYIFKTDVTPPLHSESIEQKTVQRMVQMWTNFAKRGNPNPPRKTNLINIEWEPIRKKVVNYLDIGDNLTVGVSPDLERMIFWNEILKIAHTKHKL